MYSTIIDKSLFWFKELLKFDTSNPPGNEKAAIDYVAKVLSEHGISATVLSRHSPSRPNLVAEVRGDSSAAPILLSSHVDVVPVEDASKWSAPPFSGLERDGMIWGRGALDVKYKTAFDMAALIYAKERGFKRTFKMAALSDEEVGGEEGVCFLTAKHLDLIRAEYVINEVGGFNIEIAGRNFVPIQTGEKSVLHIRFNVKGVSTHASTPVIENCLSLLGKLITVLPKLSRGFHVTKSTEAFLRALSDNLPSPAKELFGTLTSPEAADKALSLLPDPMLSAELRGMLFETLTPTITRGGFKSNVIPAECSLECDARLMPDLSIEGFNQSLKLKLREELGGDASRVDVQVLSSSNGYQIGTNSPLFCHLCKSVEGSWESLLPEVKAVPMLLPASSDNSEYFKVGITPIGFAPVLFPKGFQGFALAHGIDERLPVSSFREGLKCYLAALSSY